MTSPSHKGARPVGTDAGDPAVSFAPMGACPSLARNPAAPALALASRTANQALARQVEIAFEVGRALKAQSDGLAHAADTTVLPGPWRESLRQAAHAQATLADWFVAQALDYGRRFGGLAFARPLPGRTL